MSDPEASSDGMGMNDAHETAPDPIEESGTGAAPTESAAIADEAPSLTDLHEVIHVVEAVRDEVRALARQQELLQATVRQLSSRVSDAAASLGAPRVRELYHRLLLLYDLVDPPQDGLPQETVTLCRLIAKQIEQFLEVNGIERIVTDGQSFDPTIHKPVEFVADATLTSDTRVIATRRWGFRSASAVLRPAEVVIARRGTGRGAAVSTDDSAKESVASSSGAEASSAEGALRSGDSTRADTPDPEPGAASANRDSDGHIMLDPTPEERRP
jgi:molecular chaperone GrpE (heat shock protein)